MSIQLKLEKLLTTYCELTDAAEQPYRFAGIEGNIFQSSKGNFIDEPGRHSCNISQVQEMSGVKENPPNTKIWQSFRTQLANDHLLTEKKQELIENWVLNLGNSIVEWNLNCEFIQVLKFFFSKYLRQ